MVCKTAGQIIWNDYIPYMYCNLDWIWCSVDLQIVISTLFIALSSYLAHNGKMIQVKYKKNIFVPLFIWNCSSILKDLCEKNWSTFQHIFPHWVYKNTPRGLDENFPKYVTSLLTLQHLGIAHVRNVNTRVCPEKNSHHTGVSYRPILIIF